MKETLEILMSFPWYIQLILLSPIVSIPLIFYLRPNLKDPGDHFYYTFTRKLDKDLRGVYWSGMRISGLRTARENILNNAHRQLHELTGKSHISNMSSHHRAAWAYLWKRTHEILR